MDESAVADTAFRFVECINRADLDGLIELMTDDHELIIFGEQDLKGKEKNREGWTGYFELCPDYMIYIWEVHVRGDLAILIGSTTGSHLKQPRLEEFRDPLIWTAKVRDGLVCEWALHHLNDETKAKLGI
jgi:ketosteroid isomerase-like protein